MKTLSPFILQVHFQPLHKLPVITPPNQFWAHNPVATQCNQSQNLTLLKHIYSHSPSASQVSQANLSNSLTSQYPPDPGEPILKESATEIGEQDFPVNG